MKRTLLRIVAGLLLISFAACTTMKPMQQPNTPNATGTLTPIELPSQWPEEPIVTDPPVVPISEGDDIEPEEPTDLSLPDVSCYADFAHVLCASLIDGKSNRNFSPISVYLALAMLTEGAGSVTRAELLRLLGCESIEQLRGVVAGMLETLSIDEDTSKLDLHNSLWMAKDVNGLPVEFNDAFLTELAETYRSEANTVEFGKQSASQQIADWVRTQTRDKIKLDPSAFQFEPSTIAVLINTIYLKDNWAQSFSETSTEPGAFYGLNEKGQPETMTVDYMRRFDKNCVVSQGDGWLRYRVYLSRIGYVSFVLPDEGVSLDHLLGSPEALDKLLHQGVDKAFDVSLMIPKFSFQDKAELTALLASLGLLHCFNPGADFTNMCDASCMVDSVLQESFIGVDENGVEAAAYTMITMRNTAFSPVERERLDFHLTRPFLYAIESHDGTLLFVGTVTEPSASKLNP